MGMVDVWQGRCLSFEVLQVVPLIQLLTCPLHPLEHKLHAGSD